MDIKNIPEELLDKREQIECSFIFTFYKDMSLIPDYETIVINGEDIITSDGQFYYGLILGLNRHQTPNIYACGIKQYYQEQVFIPKTF